MWRALRLLMATWRLLCHICIHHYGHQSRFSAWSSLRVSVAMQGLSTLGEVMESEIMSRVLACLGSMPVRRSVRMNVYAIYLPRSSYDHTRHVQCALVSFLARYLKIPSCFRFICKCVVGTDYIVYSVQGGHVTLSRLCPWFLHRSKITGKCLSRTKYRRHCLWISQYIYFLAHASQSPVFLFTLLISVSSIAPAKRAYVLEPSPYSLEILVPFVARF